MTKFMEKITKYINLIFGLCYIALANWMTLIYLSSINELNNNIHVLFLPPIDLFGVFFIAIPLLFVLKFLVFIVIPINILYLPVYCKKYWKYRSEIFKNICKKLKQLSYSNKTLAQKISLISMSIFYILEVLIVIAFSFLLIAIILFVGEFRSQIFSFSII